MLSLVIDRDQAARFGIQPALIDSTLYDAFGQRQVAQYFTQLNSYHVVLEVTAGAAGRSGHAATSSTSSRRLTGQMVPLSTFVALRHSARRPTCRSTTRGSFRR